MYSFTLFQRQGIEMEFIVALRAAVSNIQTDFQDCYNQ